MKNNETAIVIAGAGPAGSVTSLFLCRNKIPHIILDKSSFPRDKICGDALSGKVVDILRKLDGKLLDELNLCQAQALGSYGVKFGAPNGTCVDIPFAKNIESLKSAPGFISRRVYFDDFLFQKIDRTYATVIENAEVKELIRKENRVEVTYVQQGSQHSISCKLIVGAEGDRSVVARKLGGYVKDDRHYCAGLRAYYKGVKNFHPQNFIELHFLKELLPGYFWIFPMANGEANVGLGMLSADVSKRKINLKQSLMNIIQHHPEFKKRFEGAQLVDGIKGWGLPLGSKKRKISGSNFLLTGDAASLIDPFTGEGIGNAMLSGMVAAKHIQCALTENRFDENFLSEYDREVYGKLWNELKISRTLQRLSRYPWLFNLVINKASKSERLRNTIMIMFDNLEARKRLQNPLNYFKLFYK
ncbi:MAG: geranylgeranyl reductase family protein [Bacteroidetes bacterium]|nr:geranylgeranyl reductase family protein [Bacteroidota bacterium]